MICSYTLDMKKGDKLKVIDNEKIIQTTLEVGVICEFVKSFDNYACVFFDGREMLINKELLIEVEDEI